MPETKRSLKVFLCHASQDKPVVRELSQRLFAEGWIDPWLDEKKLLPGQDWRVKIEEAVETSDVVIICLSCNSVNKEGYVQKELRYAREIALEKLEESIFLIPLRLDDCIVPRGLRFYQWVDYFGERKGEAYNALIESLKLRHEQKLMIEERERVRKEELEREVAEKIAREKAEHEAVEKTRLEAEELIQQQAAKSKAELEAVEKAARKAQLETEERARQNTTREKAKHEAARKTKLERTKPELVEEKTAPPVHQLGPKEIDRKVPQRNSGVQTNLWIMGFAAVVFVIISMLTFDPWNILHPRALTPTKVPQVTFLPFTASKNDAPAKAVEDYLQALVTKDANRLSTLSCTEWKDEALLEFDSFQSLSTRLEGLSCEQTGTDGEIALVLCKGKIIATYNNEDQNLDLSVRTYQVVQQGGEWLICGVR